MMSVRKLLWVVFLIVLLFPVGLAEAKRGRREKVIIRGWGLPSGGVEVPRSVVNTALFLDRFVEVESKTEPPTNLGVAYTITRYRLSSETNVGWRAFYRFLYYPDPAGGRGYVVFLGTFNGYWQYWPHGEGYFRVTWIGELAIRQVLKRHGVLSSVWFTTTVPD